LGRTGSATITAEAAFIATAAVAVCVLFEAADAIFDFAMGFFFARILVAIEILLLE
jgi:hypothetical protein